MDYKSIIYQKERLEEGAIATIILNQPDKLNVFNDDLWKDLHAGLTEAEDDDDVKVVIIKGNGRAFSAGFNLERVYYLYGGGTGKPEDKTRRPSERVRLKHDRWRSEGLRRIFLCPKVTIAQVHGICVGGGLYVSLCCDITVAADDAQIGHTEQRLGFAGTMYVLPIEIMLIGQKMTRELLLTGRYVDGKEAKEIGLVNKTVPADKLDEETRKLAKAITLMPRDGLAIGKAWSNLTYDSMGLSAGFAQGYTGHTMFTNTRFEDDEFIFLKQRRDKGTKAAFHARDARYSGLV